MNVNVVILNRGPMTEVFLSERKLFDDNLSSWRIERLGQHVLIKGEQVIGFFNSLDEAFNEGCKLYGLDTFFIEQILPEDVVNVSILGQLQHA